MTWSYIICDLIMLENTTVAHFSCHMGKIQILYYHGLWLLLVMWMSSAKEGRRKTYVCQYTIKYISDLTYWKQSLSTGTRTSPFMYMNENNTLHLMTLQRASFNWYLITSQRASFDWYLMTLQRASFNWNLMTLQRASFTWYLITSEHASFNLYLITPSVRHLTGI